MDKQQVKTIIYQKLHAIACLAREKSLKHGDIHDTLEAETENIYNLINK